jgi:hypothetical protein
MERRHFDQEFREGEAPARPDARRSTQDPYTSSLYGFRGLPADNLVSCAGLVPMMALAELGLRSYGRHRRWTPSTLLEAE